MNKLAMGVLTLALNMPEALAAGKYCDPPDYLVRAPASLPDSNLDSLLSRKEKEDENSLQNLFKKPGPYGHSELGFRYLARAFGFKGNAIKPSDVELWLAQREATNPLYRGSSLLWKKWVRDPDFLLRPRHSEAQFISFFPSPTDSVEFSSCISTEISRLKCENYIGRPIESSTRVYYGSETSRSPCSIHYMGGKLSNETPDSMETTATRTTKGQDGWETTEKKSWKWDFKAYTAGSAKSATGLEQGTQGAPTAK